MLTLWEYFADIEGAELGAKIEKNVGYPIIIGRSIRISLHQGISILKLFPLVHLKKI